MKFKFNRSKHKKKEKNVENENEQTKPVVDESLQMPSDDDGKIVFVFKESTPRWLIDELNKRFRSNKNRGSKCGILPA